MGELFYCANCGATVQLGKDLRCEVCGSDAVMSTEKMGAEKREEEKEHNA